MKNKILVIDDDETITSIIKSLLNPAGYEITTATDGESGLEHAQTDQPDAILLDEKMRGMSGIDVLKSLKKQETTQNIPVIMLSGDNNLRKLSLSLDLGARDYIVKPFSNSNLLTRIKNVLY